MGVRHIDLRTNYSLIGKRRLYPWMLNIAEDPEPGIIGKLQIMFVNFSLWWSLPLVLILNSLWFAKKHDPILSYIIGVLPILGVIIVLYFWNSYESGHKKHNDTKSTFFRHIRKNFSKYALFFSVMLYSVFLLYLVIPWSNKGFGISVQLSNQKLITKPIDDYEGLYWVNLSHVHLEGANLADSVLKRANLEEAHLEESSLWGANLEGANLKGANLQGAVIRKANLARAQLQSANLEKAYLEGANLKGANLKRASLKDANLEGAHLEGANLEGSDLEGADLQEAYFEINNITSARNWVLAYYSDELSRKLGLSAEHNELVKEKDLQGYNLEGANLEEANIGSANLESVANLTVEQLSKVKTLYEVRNLDPELMYQVEDRYPHLLKDTKAYWRAPHKLNHK